MSIIKFTNKGFLREHPFLDPVSQPTPVQTHSYIYPGDELVLYHKFSFPTDASVSAMSNIKLISAKLSLIAQKPNIFTEEYTHEFQATRHFELDSFTLAFNKKVVPWGTDGYAPNVNFQQDRNWKLPSGDFRRQVNFFTEHTSSTSVWDYTFMLPILFRWEYWLALAAADNDFYNTGQPQNGQNQFWQHYFQPSVLPFGWLIKSRIELNVLLNGIPTILRNDLNLTPNSDDVLDYNSNSDWINKSVKTSKVLGTPSNSPAFIYGNKNTEVWGFLEKATNFAINEQGNLSAVVWIEPYTGAGITARTRASSLYPVGSETVFSGLSTSITDDSGLGIQTDTGDYIVIDPNGVGAYVLFDGLFPKKVKIFALIDYNKLNAVYPGVTKFTIYARLYNSTFITGTITKQGEEIKQDATFINPPDIKSLCVPAQPQCPFDLTVFADISGSFDALKNDKSDFYQYGGADISAITFILQKADNNCGGAWVDKATITDNTYGSFFAFGKNPDFSGVNFTDDYNKQYTGVFLDWRKVLAAFGVGFYRMKIIKTDVFTNSVTTYDQRNFCLKIYNCDLANRTVRIETLNIGSRGSMFDGSAVIDYAGGWRGQVRLKGVLKYKGSSYTKEFNQYGDADFNALKPVINEQNPKFILSIRPVPGWMDWILSTDVLQADEILVTDYNTNNRHKLISFPLINDGDIIPRDNQLRNPLSDVDISLSYGKNNLRKRNTQ